MSSTSLLRQFIIGIVITLAILFLALWGKGDYITYMLGSLANIHPHAPDWAIIVKQSLAVKVHILGALFAFGIGVFQFVGPKGTTMHKILGWSWVIFMGTVAISSIFIRQLNNGQFSFIHILTVITLVNLPLLVYYARMKNIKAHKGAATGLFMGALIIAGLFAFMPGRLMWEIFFG